MIQFCKVLLTMMLLLSLVVNTSSNQSNSTLTDFRVIPDFVEQFQSGKFVGKEGYPKFSATKNACAIYDDENNCIALKSGFDQFNATQEITGLLPILVDENFTSLQVVYYGNWQPESLPTYGYAFSSNQGYHPPVNSKEWNMAIKKINILANIPTFYQFIPEKGKTHFGGFQEYVNKGYHITYNSCLNGQIDRNVQITTRSIELQTFAYIEVSTQQEGIIALAYADITLFIEEIEHLLGLNQQYSKQFFHKNSR